MLGLELVVVSLQGLEHLDFLAVRLQVLLLVNLEDELLLLLAAHALDIEHTSLRRSLLVTVYNDVLMQVLLLLSSTCILLPLILVIFVISVVVCTCE